MLWRGVRVAALLLAVVVLLAGPRSASAAEAEVPVPLAEAVSVALVAWAEFATTGDVAAIESGFVVGGPQHRQLDEESSVWIGTDSLEPVRFTVRELRLRRLGPELATVWTRIEATRVGFESQMFSWDFDLIRRDGRWKVWTVVAADRPEPGMATVPRSEAWTTSAMSMTAAPDTDTKPDEREHYAVPPIESASSSQPRAGVRLPALSAWIIVITVVGVALAGYLAPRLDRRKEQ